MLDGKMYGIELLSAVESFHLSNNSIIISFVVWNRSIVVYYVRNVKFQINLNASVVLEEWRLSWRYTE